MVLSMCSAPGGWGRFYTPVFRRSGSPLWTDSRFCGGLTPPIREAVMIEVTASAPAEVFSKPALAFVEELHRNFESRRQELLAARAERDRKLAGGGSFEVLPGPASVRRRAWGGGGRRA